MGRMATRSAASEDRAEQDPVAACEADQSPEKMGGPAGSQASPARGDSVTGNGGGGNDAMRAAPSISSLDGDGYLYDTDTGRYDTDTPAPQSERQKRPEDGTTKYQKMWVRTQSSVAMIGGFILIIYMGHVPLMFLIFAIQATMCRELFKLARAGQQRQPRHRRKPVTGTRFQQWYFFFAAAFWMYLRFIQKNLLVEITSNARLARIFGWLLRRHTFVSYSLYTGGIINFVLQLEKGHYLYQFGQFAWIHMILLVVFIPTSFFVSNIFDGLIWFLLPCALVIINDISAYLTGFFFGRTPLIKLSPKKTWEGFIGGLLLTLVASWYLARYMSRFPWMVCERNDLSMGWLTCDPDNIFKDHVYTTAAAAKLLSPAAVERLAALGQRLPPWLASWLWNFRLVAAPMQIHALALSLFASVIAPFGGFFASGFKRGFKIKDFGNSIPGHGGMTDRMDCQVVMAVFAYLFFNNVVARQSVTVGYVLQKSLQLDSVRMLELFTKLGNLLVGEEVLPERFLDDFARLLRRYQVPVNTDFPALM